MAGSIGPVKITGNSNNFQDNLFDFKCAYCWSKYAKDRRTISKSQITVILGGSPGLVVKGVDLCSDGRGFESQHLLLDRHFFSYICLKL